jgi:Tol biopolymer transport system component
VVHLSIGWITASGVHARPTCGNTGMQDLRDVHPHAKCGATTMPSCHAYPRRARHRLAVVFVLAAAGLWACDGPPEESLTASSATPATSHAKDPAKKALIAFASAREGNYGIYVMTPDGRKQTRLTDTSTAALWPAWSPDRTKLAFTTPFPTSHIYVMDADGTNLRQLTNDSVYGENNPDWSPDGSRIAFERNGQIVIGNADGTNQTVVPHSDQDTDRLPSWSPDGTKLAVARDRGFTQIEKIWVISLDGTEAVQLTGGLSQDTDPEWSPDGSRIAFTTNREGPTSVYVMNADGTGQTRLTTAVGSSEWPSWSVDGAQLAIAAAGEIYVVDADGSDPTRLTENPADDSTPAWAP